MPLEPWCAEHGVSEALSGGFATKPEYAPLGELRTAGRAERYTPFRSPWDGRRGAIAAGSAGVVVSGGRWLNVPRVDEGNVLDVSSPSVSAFVFS